MFSSDLFFNSRAYQRSNVALLIDIMLIYVTSAYFYRMNVCTVCCVKNNCICIKVRQYCCKSSSRFKYKQNISFYLWVDSLMYFLLDIRGHWKHQICITEKQRVNGSMQIQQKTSELSDQWAVSAQAWTECTFKNCYFFPACWLFDHWEALMVLVWNKNTYRLPSFILHGS